ncbi:branched-chain amino acid ABC transporter permease [Mangrovitalea sediminis]|uniref:branched-chain amino acid ABC transporter permease n=1 Tax=Mangrovitalea sediminis TaxID=1982043 RepID=UPI0013041CEC|nr:branched-chain amino acid ABC transporter permease [Mangrovitalea sediminis]
MIGILVSVINGLLLGSIYGLAAIGLTLIFGVMKVINLAHGAMIALGMFALYFLATSGGMNPYLALPLVAIGGFVGGVAVYWIGVHRVIGRAELMSLLATFAVSMIIIGLGTALWSTSPYNVQINIPGVAIGNYTIPGNHLVAAVIAILIAAALYLFLFYTRLGKAIRAVASNRQAAELMGIPSTRVLAIAFGIGIGIAAVAGALIATLFPFTILSGGGYELKSFVVTVLGGLGNPAGALLGGLLLGFIEGVVSPFVDVSWTPVIEFSLFVVILIAFPMGLFRVGRGK